MLTLTVKSDGSPEDLQTIVSLAYNTGMTVVAELPGGGTAEAKPVAAEPSEPAAPAEPTSEVTESSP